jgi:hypothetical protein
MFETDRRQLVKSVSDGDRRAESARKKQKRSERDAIYIRPTKPQALTTEAESSRKENALEAQPGVENATNDLRDRQANGVKTAQVNV